MTQRIYVVGTDTEVGKTALSCALLRQAAAADDGPRVVPFKPAQSGALGPGSDAARLLAATHLDPALLPEMCPLRYEPPVAPGMADDPAPFFRPRAANTSPRSPVLEDVARALSSWETSQRADVVLIEGAGGLHVPMPGGTWQSAWVKRLANAAIVVGRAGLGTINHTLLTLDALLALDIPVLGFYLVSTTDRDDPSETDNAPVIAAARGGPLLGTLPFLAQPDAAGPFDLLSPLLAALADLS